MSRGRLTPRNTNFIRQGAQSQVFSLRTEPASSSILSLRLLKEVCAIKHYFFISDKSISTPGLVSGFAVPKLVSIVSESLSSFALLYIFSMLSVPTSLACFVSISSTFSVSTSSVPISLVSPPRTPSSSPAPLRVYVWLFFFRADIVVDDSFLLFEPTSLTFRTGGSLILYTGKRLFSG